MNIPRELISDAKNRIGDNAAEIIARGLNLSRWDTRSLKGCCPKHSEKTPSFTWNKKGHYFKCFGCGITYDIVDYYMDQERNFIDAAKKLFSEANMSFDFETEKQKHESKAKKDYKPPRAETNTSRSKAEEYLALRKISKETLDYAGVKQDTKGNIVFEFKDQAGKLLTVKYRPARKVVKPEIKTWCQKDADTTPVLYGMHQIDVSKPLLICEGEIDRLSAIEAGFKNAVSVPFGAGNYTWIEYNYEWLSQFEDILIWSDNDDAGDHMRQEVLARLGEDRCKIVRGTRNDINYQLYFEGKESVLKCIEAAEAPPIKDIVTFNQIEDFDINAADKISSGYNGLDKWTAGFVLGTLDIITGYNSSGKSTIVNHMCVSEPVSQGYRTFIYSGELTKPQLRSWIEFPLAGRNRVLEFDNGPYKPKGYAVDKKFKQYIREWADDKIIFYSNDEDNRASNILKKMKEVAKRLGVKNYVIDNLMTINLECSETEKYTKQKEFVQELKKFATQFRSVVHLIAHPRKTENMRKLTKMDIAGSGDITNLADYVISVYRVPDEEKEDEVNSKGKVIREACPFDTMLDLFKNRPLGWQDKTVGLHFDINSKRFYGDSDNLDKQYGWEATVPVEEYITRVDDGECPF